MPVELEIFISLFCICIAAFLIYLGYVYFLKKCRGYRYENGVPDVAILRNSSITNVGHKHFSTAQFRTSQFSLNSTDKEELMKKSTRRPHTFPLTSSRKHSNLPEVRVELVP